MNNRPAAVGALLLSKGFATEAIPFLKKGARINDLAPLVNLGAAYRWTNDFYHADRTLMRAVAIHPKSPEAWGNYAMLHEDMGLFNQSHKANIRALKLAPDSPQINLNAAYSYLRRGDWAKGWACFEKRPLEGMPNIPRWTGNESLEGKRLLIVPEGGYGDAIFFARWLPRMQKLGLEMLHFLVWDDMLSLFNAQNCVRTGVLAESKGVNLLDGHTGPPKLAYDYFVPLMSLAACLGATAKTVPFCDEPYLSVEPYHTFAFDGLRVGVCLTAEENRTQRPHRSVPQNLWRELVRPNSKIKFVNLAMGQFNTTGFQDWLPNDADWQWTAKIVAGLDLVISVDTAVLHLAGALGKKTWALIPHRSDAKWGMPGKWTLPYPNLKVFYQDELLSWKPTLRRVRKALEVL